MKKGIREWLYDRKARLLVGMCVLLSVGTGGCAKHQTLHVRIQEQQVQTRIDIRKPETVKDILSEAELTLGPEDSVTPSLETVIDRENAEIRISRTNRVWVKDKDNAVMVKLTDGTVQDALAQAKSKIKIGKHDYVNHSEDAYLTDGMLIDVVHRLAVTLKADGQTTKCETQAQNVKELLAEQNIKLGKYDRVTPKLDSNLKDNSNITVKRVKIKKETQTQVIPYATQTQYSKSISAGSSRVTRKGQNGKSKITYQITYVDGKEESRKKIKEKVLQKAVDQVVVKGTKPRGRTIVSKQRVDDCDGSGHGYYIIKYSDGTVKYVDY